MEARIKDGHVQYLHISAYCLRDPPPLLLHLVIVSPHPVYALHHKQVSPFQPLHQPSPSGTLKVPSRAAVGEDVLPCNARRDKGGELPVCMLIHARDAGVSVLLHVGSFFWGLGVQSSPVVHNFSDNGRGL